MNRRRRPLRQGWILGLILLPVACESLVAPGHTPLQEGQIVEITPGATTMTTPDRILVKESLDEECGVRWSFSEESMVVEGLDDGSFREIQFSDLFVGQRVRVWSIPGGVLPSSCPGLARVVWLEVFPD